MLIVVLEPLLQVLTILLKHLLALIEMGSRYCFVLSKVMELLVLGNGNFKTLLVEPVIGPSHAIVYLLENRWRVLEPMQ